MEQNGFSPYIDRYINSIQGSKRQELINQLSQLQPKDLEQLEAKLKAKYEYESFNSFDKPDYMALNGVNEEEYEMKRGGYLRMMQKAGEVIDEDQALYDAMENNIQYSQNTPSEAQNSGALELLTNGSNQQNSIPVNMLPVVSTQPPLVVQKQEAASTKAEDLDPKEIKKLLNKADKVMAIQRELKDRGYKIEVDGVYGKKTKKAIEDFQSKNKLDVDGIVGARTKMALGLINLGKEVIKPIGYKPVNDIPTEGVISKKPLYSEAQLKEVTESQDYSDWKEEYAQLNPSLKEVNKKLIEERFQGNNKESNYFDKSVNTLKQQYKDKADLLNEYKLQSDTFLRTIRNYDKDSAINYLNNFGKPNNMDDKTWQQFKSDLLRKKFGN